MGQFPPPPPKKGLPPPKELKLAIQLPLSGIALQDHATFANFYAGKNQLLCQFLSEFITGNTDQFAYLWGHEGSGRSHLLQACCHQVAQVTLEGARVSSLYLPMGNFPLDSLPDMLDGMEYFYLVCLDDIDKIAGARAAEEAIFNFYNRIREAGGRLLVAASSLPQELGFLLPDLVSRLSWGASFFLQPLSDDEKLSALQFRAKARGFILSEEVGQFILRRSSRNMSDLFLTLDKLDEASLSAGRRLTIPFVKTVLGL